MKFSCNFIKTRNPDPQTISRQGGQGLLASHNCQWHEITLVGVVQFSPGRTKGAHALVLLSPSPVSHSWIFLTASTKISLLSLLILIIPTWQIVFPICSSLSDFWVFIMPLDLFVVNSSTAFLVQCLLMLSEWSSGFLPFSTLPSTTGKNLNWKAVSAALFFMSSPS